MDLTPEGVVHDNLTVCSKVTKNKSLKSTYQVRKAQLQHVCGQISSSNQISYENYVLLRSSVQIQSISYHMTLPKHKILTLKTASLKNYHSKEK